MGVRTKSTLWGIASVPQNGVPDYRMDLSCASFWLLPFADVPELEEWKVVCSSVDQGSLNMEYTIMQALRVFDF